MKSAIRAALLGSVFPARPRRNGQTVGRPLSVALELDMFVVLAYPSPFLAVIAGSPIR
jgi:hypothetical protein